MAAGIASNTAQPRSAIWVLSRIEFGSRFCERSSGSNQDCMATSNASTAPARRIDCAWEIVAFCLMSRVTLSLSAELEIENRSMTKTLEREIGRTVQQKRRQL